MLAQRSDRTGTAATAWLYISGVYVLKRLALDASAEVMSSPFRAMTPYTVSR
jgi:hypothetical protein